MKRVVIVDSVLKRFRATFYVKLREYLQPMGVDLQLVHGQPDKHHASDTNIVAELPFAHQTRNRYLYVGDSSLVWQPALKYLKGADLVIVQQGNRHMLNHLLLMIRRLLGMRVAFWGHGRNYQNTRRFSIREMAKRFYSRYADHWFAYTEATKGVLLDMGVAESKITVVQNAIDTASLVREYENVTPQEVRELRDGLGIGDNAPVAIYCGHFRPNKDLDFTLECAREIRSRVDRFHFVLVGGGVETPKVQAFCREHSAWAHYVGPQYGHEKAKYFSLACCQIMPGAVGLSIVDSFAFLTPMLTRDIPSHGPEIAYLEHGKNGLLVSGGDSAYIDALEQYLKDPETQEQLRRGCASARKRYTMENMVQNYARGIVAALA